LERAEFERPSLPVSWRTARSECREEGCAKMGCRVRYRCRSHSEGRETQRRWRIAAKDKALPEMLKRPLIEARAKHLLRAMEIGNVSTNVYLRRIHNFALDLSWLPAPIIPKRQWPTVRHRDRRAITFEEHQKIVAREFNPERKAFYELAWHIGASQSDIAFLGYEDIDWGQRVISYQRMKTGEYALIRFDAEVERILRALPKEGPLFPYLRTVQPGTGRPSSCSGPVPWTSRGCRSIPTATRGRNAPAAAATPSASPKRRWGTTARPFIGPTPAKPKWWCRPSPPTNHNRRATSAAKSVSRAPSPRIPRSMPPSRHETIRRDSLQSFRSGYI